MRIVFVSRQRTEHIGVDSDGFELVRFAGTEIMLMNTRISNMLKQIGFADTANSDQRRRGRAGDLLHDVFDFFFTKIDVVLSGRVIGNPVCEISIHCQILPQVRE